MSEKMITLSPSTKFSLDFDVINGKLDKSQRVIFHDNLSSIEIEFPGFEYTTEFDNLNIRVALEICEGELRVVVWDDPCSEEPKIIPIKNRGDEYYDQFACACTNCDKGILNFSKFYEEMMLVCDKCDFKITPKKLSENPKYKFIKELI